jgi:dipeptidase E
MADDNSNNLYDFKVNGEMRTLSFIKSVKINEVIDCNIYAFVDDKTHQLAVYEVNAGVKTPAKKVPAGHRIIEGYVHGKGTLTINLIDGTMNIYYFEKDGSNVEVEVEAGQTIQWTAPVNSILGYYEVTEIALPKPAPPKPKTPVSKTKLFLTSMAMSDLQSVELAKLVGKQPQETTIALIENAADVELNSESWVTKNRESIAGHGYKIEVIDLKVFRHSTIDLLQILQKKDVIWLGGGNTFYLRWLLKYTRAEEIIRNLIKHGKIIYAGSSAGEIVAGPTIKYFEAVDDPKKTPEIVVEGLNFTDTVVVPHMDNVQFAQAVKEINEKLIAAGYKTVPLNENQSLIIDGDSLRVVA